MPAATSLASAASRSAPRLGRPRREVLGKLPADDGGDLRNLAGLAKTVETRHQRILAACAGTAAPSSPADSITLLVNSSANSGTPSVLATIAATVSADSPCEAAIPATSSAHSARPRRPSVSSVECGRAEPGRREIRPRGDQDEQAAPPDAVGHARHHFERGRVDPVRVLHHEQHRLASPSGRSRRPAGQSSPAFAAPGSATSIRAAPVGIDKQFRQQRDRGDASAAARCANRAPSFSIRARANRRRSPPRAPKWRITG